jgi:hypothetical protein
MPVAPRSLLVILSVLAGVGALEAQAAPTLPSDTLEANYAPRIAPGPMPQVAPSLPSDTLQAAPPSTPGDAWPASPDSAGAAERPSRTPWRLLPLEPPPPRIIPARA